MKKSKKVIVTIVGILLVFFLGLWLFRIIRLNREFQQTKLVADMGEAVEYNGVTYTVTDAVIYDTAALVQEWEDFSWLGSTGQYYLCDLYDGNDRRYLVCTVHIRLGDGEPGERIIVPGDIQTQSGLFTNVYELFMYEYLLPDDLTWYPNAEVDVRIPFDLPQHMFTEEEWNQLSEEDPKLELIVAYQPEIVKLRVNHVSHVWGDEQAVKELDSLIETALILRETREKTATVVQETNVYENNEGDCNGIHYSVDGLREMTLEEVQAVEDDAKKDFYANRTDDQSPYFIQTSVTMTNTMDQIAQVYLTSTRLCFVEGEGVIASMELFHMDVTQMPEGHDGALYVLEPGESITVSCIYDVLASPRYMEKINGASDCYLAVNPNGIDFHSLRDKAVVFIKYENELQTE